MSRADRRYGPTDAEYASEYGMEATSPCTTVCTPYRQPITGENQEEEYISLHRPNWFQRRMSRQKSITTQDAPPERAQRRIGLQPVADPHEWTPEKSQTEIALTALSGELERLTGVRVSRGKVNKNWVSNNVEFDFANDHNADTAMIERKTGRRCKATSSNSLKIY